MKHKLLEDIKIFSISKLRAILEFAKLHIRNDNGIFHLTVSANRPDMAKVFKHDLKCRYRCVYPKCNQDCLRLATPDIAVDSAIKMLIENESTKPE